MPYLRLAALLQGKTATTRFGTGIAYIEVHMFERMGNKFKQQNQRAAPAHERAGAAKKMKKSTFWLDKPTWICYNILQLLTRTTAS